LQQPTGFEVTGREGLVCNSKKSLYGLEQSPRQWHQRFDRFVIGQSFIRSDVDHCVYYRRGGNHFVVLVLYVDDIIFSDFEELVKETKSKLSSEFDMKDLV
jgi:hypothetical protein